MSKPDTMSSIITIILLNQIIEINILNFLINFFKDCPKKLALHCIQMYYKTAVIKSSVVLVEIN